MDQNMDTPLEEAPKKKNTGLIVAIIVVAVLCCCCIVGIAAVYFGYDALGDPMGIYGLIPMTG